MLHVVEPAARALLYCSEPAAPAVVEPAACALLLLSQWLMLCCC